MKSLLIVAGVILWSLTTYWTGYNTGQADLQPEGVTVESTLNTTTGFTSIDVWNEVNAYRQSKGLAPMEVYEPLCDNLVARYHAINDSSQHAGLQEFFDQQVANGILPHWMRITEVFAFGNSAKETVDAWKGSMGHELAITKHSKGCAYHHGTLSIILMTD